MQLSTSEMGMVALSKSENRDEWPKTEDEKSDLIKMVVGVASILACALFHGDQVRSRLLKRCWYIQIFVALTRNHVCMQNVCEIMVAQRWISTVLNTGFHVRLSEDKYMMKNLLTIHTIATQVRTAPP
jgi:cell division protein FtsW (lipid II flippase)